MIDPERLKILTESAKYDVSCSSSGSSRKNEGGIGNAAYGGICHSFTPDGRCISLLKILLSNRCVYDCQYCVNRRSNDVPRASATPDEICELVISFYKRNFIEGLFLSSAVDGSPDDTMEKLVDVVVKLRKVYGFHGYIHLKGIPHADERLSLRAGLYVDRMSYNVELPSEQSLRLLAPQKTRASIFTPMRTLTEARESSRPGKFSGKSSRLFLPAGQTTQMIVGATKEADGDILRLSQGLYRGYGLKRVYYSSYIPANFQSAVLPQKPVGLLREHRLYQADWLLRFYGFTAEELLAPGEDLAAEFDPKCAWALRHPELFPVEINAAPLETLLRVPGIGVRSASRILLARKHAALTHADLIKMRIVMKRAVHFITCNGHYLGEKRESEVKNSLILLDRSASAEQLSLFSSPEIGISAAGGEL